MIFVKPREWMPAHGIMLEYAADRVVKSVENTMVVAGPGAGKTELLAQRASYLLQTGICAPPQKILAISFKVDAAANLAERVRKRCGNELCQRFESRTYDSFAKHLLDHFRNSIEEMYRPVQDYEIVTDKIELKKLVVPHYKEQYPVHKLRYDTLMEYLGKERLPMPSTYNVNDVYSLLANDLWGLMPKGSKGFPATLTFSMITRLVEYLTRTNTMIKNALKVTYSHLFLDEFQDTTNVQYDMLKQIFQHSKTVITAVGDDKQRIMGWAGALPNAFQEFKNDFSSKEESLIKNHRSVPFLIDIQNYLARDLDPSSSIVEYPSIMTDGKTPPGVCQIWKFKTHLQEADYLSRKIKEWLEEKDMNPRDLCIIVKQQEDIYADQIISVLKSKGIIARVEKEFQDLLSEECITLLIHILTLVMSNRAPDSWQMVFDVLILLNSNIADKSEDFYKYDSELTNFISKLKTDLPNLKNGRELEVYLKSIFDFFGEDKYCAMFPKYRGGKYLNKKVKEFSSKLASSYRALKNWELALNDILGYNSIPIMTIHKSKGLEYHTVIFVGLEDAAFWNFVNNSEEDKRAFFVAFSRAKQRVLFTYSEKRIIKHYEEIVNRRQSSNNISVLYTNLLQAGAEIVELVEAESLV
ncbi:UvrD-helicase domain-containing protein [Paenibacillus pasadenensis]|uniref:UvrD-helicase domain-containing protein n=1 Tax=Paenibacillus pasadenensis TaxID=217090 RepID=UPI00203BC64D|nr:ATP-dependent helicase [Paenibacillus pasadenensis]